MFDVCPQHQKYLQDAFGSPIHHGDCVIDHDCQVGQVRLDLGPGFSGPGSPYWDGWFNVTRTRTEHPLRGKAMTGELVQILGGSRS